MIDTQTSPRISWQSRSHELRMARIATALRAPPKEPERLRGSKGFLTWAFVLAQAAAADLFVGGGARATEEDDIAAQTQPQADLNVDQLNSPPRIGAAIEDQFSQDDATSIATPKVHVAPPAAMQVRSVAPTLGNPSHAITNAAGGGGGGGGGGDDDVASSSFSFGYKFVTVDGDALIGPIGGGGLLNGGLGPLEVGVGPITVGLNPVHVDPVAGEFNFGAGVNLGSILGFDVTFGREGLIVSADLDLNQLSIDELVSNVTQIIEAPAIDLSNLTNSDIAGLGAISGLTMAQLTGLQLPGMSTPQHGLIEDVNALSSKDPSVVATLVPGLTHLRTLGETGNAASGETLIFPMQPVNPIASVDQLFAGNQHTDYGMALQGIQSAAVPAGALAGDAAASMLAAGQAVPLDDHHVTAPPTPLPSSLDDLSLRSLSA